MKSIYILLFLLINPITVIFSQETDRVVTITVSGSGKTKEEAKQNALRSAIEQAFGTFISSKTEILNDQIISDQITSVSSGNIKSFEIIDESTFSENNNYVTLKAIVSVNNLIKFSKSKGFETTLNGSLFSFNIKNKLLNENSELISITNLYGQLHNSLQNSMDFKLNVKEPTNASVTDASKRNWNLPIEIEVRSNSNMSKLFNLVIKILNSLTLSDIEVTEFEKLNIPYYPLIVTNSKIEYKYFLRNENSHKLLMALKTQWRYYCKNFELKYNDKSIFGFLIPSNDNENIKNYEEVIFSKNIAPNRYSKNSKELNYHEFGTNNDFKHDITDKNNAEIQFYLIKKIAFEAENTLLMKINFNMLMNLEELEKIDKVKVENKGNLFPFEYGVIHNNKLDENFGIAPIDETPENLNKMKFAGFTDWQLPNITNLNLLANYAYYGIGGFGNTTKFDFRRFYSGEQFVNQFWTLYHYHGEIQTNNDEMSYFLFKPYPYTRVKNGSDSNSEELTPFNSLFTVTSYWPNNLLGNYSTRSIRKIK
jgi:hypothetical protein